MDRSGTTGNNHRELARIETALDGNLTHALRHIIAGYAVHTCSRFFNAQIKRLRNMFFNRCPSGIDI